MIPSRFRARVENANWQKTLLVGNLLFLCNCATNDGKLFNVTATLEDTTCGSGVLDMDDSRSFQVRLTLDDSTLTWYDVDSGKSSEGTLSNEEFSVSAGNTYQVSEASETDVGCSLRRHDKYSGDATVSSGDDENAIKKLSGTLVYTYKEATGYNCDSYIGESDGIEDLPCEVEYTFVAKPD